jgi:hypothetical protein
MAEAKGWVKGDVGKGGRSSLLSLAGSPSV